MPPTFDEFDRGISWERERMLNSSPEYLIRVGDFVRFPDQDNLYRVSYIWTDENGKPESVQTTKGGSFYLGRGYVSHSGSLLSSVPASSLSRAMKKHDPDNPSPYAVSYYERAEGNVWFFHHDWSEKDNGVNTAIAFRVFNCHQNAPKS